MKYRLDSARKNKTRLKRRFITSPPKKKTKRIPRRTSKWNIGLVLWYGMFAILVGLIIYLHIYTRPPVVEYRTKVLMEQPQIPLVPPLPPSFLQKEKAPKVIKKDTSNCYQARRNGVYYTDCNWK
jgi:hypothetical protein